MDHKAKAVRVQSPFQRPREPSVLVAVVAAFLLIALVKPWSFGENGSDSGGSAAPGAIPSGTGHGIDAEPSPAPTSTILDPNAMACLTDQMEQVVIIERWAGHEVRSWVASVDMTASGPLDARLEPVSIFSSHVIGLGVCAPRAQVGTQGPAALLLDVQSIVQAAGGQMAVDIGRPAPITVQPSGQDLAVLYGAPGVTLSRASAGPAASEPPPRTSSGTGLPAPTDLATWPTGSYAIAFRFPSDAPYLVRWLRIDLVRGAGASD